MIRRQGVERERAADGVDREPADPGHQRHQRRGQRVAPEAERDPAEHHLRDAVVGAAGRERRVGQRAEPVADHDGERGLPEVQAERRNREHAEEDRGEFEVGGGPGPEQLERFAVFVGGGDRFDPARFDGDDLVAVLGVLAGGLRE
jgi:hypothetical protein